MRDLIDENDREIMLVRVVKYSMIGDSIHTVIFAYHLSSSVFDPRLRFVFTVLRSHRV